MAPMTTPKPRATQSSACAAARHTRTRCCAATSAQDVRQSLRAKKLRRQRGGSDGDDDASELAPVERAETTTLPNRPSVPAALKALEEELANVARRSLPFRSGVMRIEVHVPRAATVLDMLAALPAESGVPRAYFSPRAPAGRSPLGVTARAEGGPVSRLEGAAMAYGGARVVRGTPNEVLDQRALAAVKRWLPAGAPRARAYGASRFDHTGWGDGPASSTPSPEWATFGSYAFVLPLVEAREVGSQGLVLACHVAWDAAMQATSGCSEMGHATVEQAASAASAAAQLIRRNFQAAPPAPPPLASDWEVLDQLTQQQPDRATWDTVVSDVTAHLSDDATQLRKVVLARRTDLLLRRRRQRRRSRERDDGGDETVRGEAAHAAVRLLASLNRRDGDAAYQFLLDMGGDAQFLGSTPERLFVRTGNAAASEAVAGTRPRGSDVSSDAELADVLLACEKENDEFVVVRERVRAALASVAAPDATVAVEEARGVLRQANVQHLYSRLGVTLRDDVSHADLLTALHPTPAVCGEPRELSRLAIRSREPFDRGLYAGPVGWIEHERCEFAVALRSALVLPCIDDEEEGDDARLRVLSYAGVGVVQGATAANEWAELDLKTSQITSLLLQRAPPLRSCLNANTAWALALVEELARNGVRHICVAPGSRSTPLAAAAAVHPLLDVHVAIDERSLAFYALGLSRGMRCVHGRQAAPPAVICTSGTAAANLLPAAWEADNAEVPLLLLTADRPAELVDVSANQAVDQSDILGKKARWHADIPPPDGMPLRTLLTAAAQAVARSRDPAYAGPVHLNIRFREPLHPGHEDGWNADALLEGTERWVDGNDAYVMYEGRANAAISGNRWDGPLDGGAAKALRDAGSRGLVVAGACLGAEEAVGAAKLAAELGWPLVADASSGLRVGGAGAAPLAALDQALLACEKDATLWDAVMPDAVVQIGAPPTSKRVQSMLERVSDSGGTWLVVAPSTRRLDFSHRATHRVCASVHTLVDAIRGTSERASEVSAYEALLRSADQAVRHTLADAIDGRGGESKKGSLAAELSATGEPGPEPLSEPWVARYVTAKLPRGHGLFLGNSMPIRDVEFYATPGQLGGGITSFGDAVAANRGASGIDGVVSCAAGFAAGLERPSTLLIGDVSFSHDAIAGLQLMRSGEGSRAGENPRRPALTAVVLNNGGGAIFDFLPLSRDSTVSPDDFRRLWGTPPGLDLAQLCASVGVAHDRCETRAELASSLSKSWLDGRPRVVECMLPNSAANRELHARIGALAMRASSRVLRTGLNALRTSGAAMPRIVSAEVSTFAIPWCRASTSGDDGSFRRGCFLHVRSACGAEGVGECAPLPGLHAESLHDAASQLATAAAMLPGASLSPVLLSLDEGGSSMHLTSILGAPLVRALHPSVRSALEGALVQATAQAANVPLSRALGLDDDVAEAGGEVLVSSLVAGNGTPEEAAAEAQALVAQGFRCLKLKVARRAGGAKADAAAVCAVRAAVGPDVVLRCDANRGFSAEDARTFGELVRDGGARLQYVEEPLVAGSNHAEELLAFVRHTGVPIALDETLDEVVDAVRARGAVLSSRQFRQALPWATRSNGVEAAVLKPSRLGGLSTAAAALEWARGAGVGLRGVLSSAFDTGVALAPYVVLARAADAGCFGDGIETGSCTHHGLWTHEWLGADASAPKLVQSQDGGTAIDVATAPSATSVASDGTASQPLARFDGDCEVEVDGVVYRMHYTEWHSDPIPAAHSGGNGNGAAPEDDVLVLLHGFLGTGAEWEVVAQATAAAWHSRVSEKRDDLGDSSACARRLRIIAPDLPGHGLSRAASGSGLEALSIERISTALTALVEKVAPSSGAGSSSRRAVVGYSMGGRMALRLILHADGVFPLGAVAVSASPGLRDAGSGASSSRAAVDARRANILRRCVSAASGDDSGRLREFSRAWYANDNMWRVFRAHPNHASLVHNRCGCHDPSALADSLEGASPAVMEPLWDGLAARDANSPPLVLMAGSCDDAYVKVLGTAAEFASASDVRLHVLPLCDHAVHTERPDEVANQAAALFF
ncbi:2-succinyl-5-enolpyruvyl-6-hydroxy-3-cyclohexene-1-carboxylic-acid synthase [Pseudoscourfieldia marina]